MDDQKFDDIIRSKLSDYEDNAFDPGSLASLRRQLDDASGSVPWYTRHHHQIITIATVLFCAFLLLSAQWYWNRWHGRIGMDDLSALRTQIAENARLRDEITRLKNLRPDTVRIIEVRDEDFTRYRSLILQHRMLEAEVADLRHQMASLHGRMETLELLDSERLLTRSREPSRWFSNPSPVIPAYRSIVSDAIAKPNMHVERKVPSAMSRDLQKHYQKGIGIKMGPALDFSAGNYSSGQGQLAVGYGILGDLIFSPSISVEIAAKYFKRYYEIADRAELADVNLPDANGSGGVLLKAEIDNWMLELPVALKYRYLLSPARYGLAGVGYSTSIYMNQVFEYDYQFNNGDFLVHSLYRHKATNVYPGTVNFSIGLSNKLKNGKSIEATVVYQHGLGTMGVERNKASYLGVRTVYWFTLR